MDRSTSRFGGRRGYLRIYASGFLPAGHFGPHSSPQWRAGLPASVDFPTEILSSPSSLSHQGDSRLLYLGTDSWVNSRLKDKRLHSKNRESLLLVLEAEVSGVLGVPVSFAASGRGLCGSAAGWPGAQSSRQMSVL